KPLLEAGVKRNGVERHLDVDRSGELGAHSSHALAGRTLALMGFPLNQQHVAATSVSQMPRNARTHNTAADNHDIRCLHLVWPPADGSIVIRERTNRTFSTTGEEFHICVDRGPEPSYDSIWLRRPSPPGRSSVISASSRRSALAAWASFTVRATSDCCVTLR